MLLPAVLVELVSVYILSYRTVAVWIAIRRGRRRRCRKGLWSHTGSGPSMVNDALFLSWYVCQSQAYQGPSAIYTKEDILETCAVLEVRYPH
jgi:hypothetical protein